MPVIFEHHIKFNNTKGNDLNTAFSFLCKSIENTGNRLTKAQIKQAINKGALWLTRGKHTQRLRRIKKPLQINDELHLYYNEAILSREVPEATLISDEGSYSVWYKPFGMLSQGSKWSDHCTITRFAQQNLIPERPVFIVHRLDKAATGLILIAHTKKTAQALSAMFEQRSKSEHLRDKVMLDHSLEKHYQIIVHGDHRVFDQPQIISSDVDGKKARSTFSCLEYNQTNNESLVSVKIDSGRKHQIRIHAASIGLPVVGDRLHGIADNSEARNLQLCAVSLDFICPLSLNDTPIVKKHFELTDALKPQLL